MQLFSCLYKSPIGNLIIVCTDSHLTEVSYTTYLKTESFVQNKICKETENQLSEYFCGKRKEFTIPIQFIHGTEFQKKVWLELTKIKYGQTASYKDIASSLGNPKAGRAVGAANRKNPISIIIPCHRIINSDGTINGYAGGVDKKKKLLAMEASFTIMANYI